MKQENRNSHASLPPSVGGREKPSSLSIGVPAPAGSSSTSVGEAERFCDCGVNSISVLLLDAMAHLNYCHVSDASKVSSWTVVYNALKSGSGGR